MTTNTKPTKPQSYSSAFSPITSIPAPLSSLLEIYSNIPPSAQLQHVNTLRNEAYANYPYPCIGGARFMTFNLANHPAYQEHVLAPLKQPVRVLKGEAPEPLFLDLGTCFGQDVRKLIFDGAPVERVWASDVVPELIELGFRMFCDEERLPGDHFLCPGDLLAGPGVPEREDRLKVLDGRLTILHMHAVFHLFTYEDQKRVVDRCLRLFRKDMEKPVLLLGAQVGSLKAGEWRRATQPEYSHKYRHNEESWKRLWEEVCQGEAWQDKIAKLDVRSRLLSREENEEGKEGQIVVDKEMRRHVFEIWITFR